jgi:prepilin-type N-terminal cleavage/methylation domain-containing protein
MMIRESRFQPIKKSARPIVRRGFTLMEALVASVVLLILALGVVGSVSTAYEQSQFVHDSATSLSLAKQLMDEIVSKPYVPADALGTTGNTGPRSAFTNVSAYNKYSDASTSMPMLTGATLDVTGSESFVRSVSVSKGTKPSIDTASPTNDFAIVTVTITNPDGQTVSVPELVANYSIQR